MKVLKTYLSDFLSLFYPEPCLACGNALVSGERFICTYCLYHLPYTGYHTEKENKLVRNFWGRIPLEHGTSCFHFSKGGKVQQLLHQLKYKGQKELGNWIGEKYGAELKLHGLFNDADLLIPVPLHIKKLRQRGYNQSERFAEGLSRSLNIPCRSDMLIRTGSSSTQTSKSRYERYENSTGMFRLKDPQQLCGKHVILVDDVITTGATLEACAGVLHQAGNVKISVLTIASTV